MTSEITHQFSADTVSTYQDPQDLLSRLEDGRQAYGDAFTVSFNGLRCAVFSHPHDIQRVFTDRNFSDKGPIYDGVRQVIGDGILTSSGEKWQSNHRLIAPQFHRRHVSEMVSTIARAGHEYAVGLQQRSKDGLVVDLQEEMTGLTLNTLGAVIFGGNAALQDLSYDDLRSTFSLASRMGDAVDDAARTRHKSIAGRLDKLTSTPVQSAREQEPDSTLLSMLVHTKDAETGEYMDDRAIRDELLTIMFAGHETTALSLMWLFKTTQGHPAIRMQIQEEAQSVLAGAMPTAEDLPKLTMLRQTIDEVLRMLPPVPITARSVKEATEIRGMHLEPGDAVMPFIWGAHRHPEFWRSPETFDPARFSPEQAKGRDKWSYLPFAAGSRICIGQSFALAEIAIHATLLTQAVDIRVAENEITPKVSMTLRPSSPVYAQVRPL